MSLTYFRRFRMQIDLRHAQLPEPQLPEEFRWVPWAWACVDRHAHVKHQSFAGEVDSAVFECFSSEASCRELMHAIARQVDFLPTTTWLITRQPFEKWTPSWDCATIQGLAQTDALGSIQNVGVVPDCRGLGLGRLVVLKSLHAFRDLGFKRVSLEVTASNTAAVRLYWKLGFRIARTLYKRVEHAVDDSVAGVVVGDSSEKVSSSAWLPLG